MKSGVQSKSRVGRPQWLLPALVALSAAVYMPYVAATNRDVAFTMPLVDGAAYHAQALAGLTGAAPEPKPYWQPPLYAWWLTAVYRVLGPDPARVRYAQFMFVAATVALVFLAGRRIGGVPAGTIAALAVIFNGPFLFYCGQFFPAALAALLDLFAVCLLLRAVELDRARDWLFCGLAMGLAALAVPNILAVAAAAVVWRAAARRGGSRAVAAGKALSLMAGLLVCILPVTVRNAAVSHQFVPISTNAGVNLFIGNNARMESTMAARPGMDWDRLVRIPFLDGARTEAEAQACFVRRVMAYAAADPRALMRGFWYKARLLCTGLETPRNVDAYVFAQRSALLRPLVWRVGGFGFPFGVLAPLAVVGLVLRRRNRDTRVIVLCMLVYAATMVLFFPSGRYRAPMIPLLALTAGLAGAEVVAAAAQRRIGRERMTALAAGCLAALACLVPVRPPDAGVDFAAELENALGTGLEVRGYRAAAMERYRAAIAVDPLCFEAHYNLANAMRAEGRLDDALTHYRATLALRPDHDKALTNMGIALAQAGRIREAVQSLKLAVEYDPWSVKALLSLGACHIRAGDPGAGVECLEAALKLEPLNVAALQNLAGALLVLKRYEDSVRRCREALALAPDNAAVHNTLGMALLSLDRRAEAEKHILRAAQLNPRYRRGPRED